MMRQFANLIGTLFQSYYRYLVCKYQGPLRCSGKGKLNYDGQFKSTEPHDKECKEAFMTENASFRASLYHSVKSQPSQLKDIYTAVAIRYVENTRIRYIFKTRREGRR